MTEPDEARDPHLREALRHAPDAQLQPPDALRELIFKEARAKARGAKPAETAAPGAVRNLWNWLARPAVATGFAGVMAATLVGLMWWDQPMDEALPRSPVPAAAPAAEKAAPRPAAEAPVAATPAPPTDAAPPAPKPEPARKIAAEAPRSAQPGTTAPLRAEAPPAPRRGTAERDTRGGAGAVSDHAAAGATAPATTPAPPATPAPAAPAAPAPAPAPAAALPSQWADTTTESPLARARARDEEQKRERSTTAPAEVQSRRAAAKAMLNESRLQLEAEAYTRVASVRAAIAAEPARWAWQRAQAATAAPQPMNDAVYAWLAQLDGSTGTGWQPRNARETAAPRGRALTLLRDGQLQHSFQLTERGVLWQRGQTAWQVELPAETLAALQAALESTAP